MGILGPKERLVAHEEPSWGGKTWQTDSTGKPDRNMQISQHDIILIRYFSICY